MVSKQSMVFPLESIVLPHSDHQSVFNYFILPQPSIPTGVYCRMTGGRSGEGTLQSHVPHPKSLWVLCHNDLRLNLSWTLIWGRKQRRSAKRGLSTLSSSCWGGQRIRAIAEPLMCEITCETGHPLNVWGPQHTTDSRSIHRDICCWSTHKWFLIRARFTHQHTN